MEYLGYKISAEGIRPTDDKVLAVKTFERPDCPKKLRQFLGMASFNRRFIPAYAILAADLYALLEKDAKWHWSDTHEKAFNKIKELLITKPVLHHIRPDQPFKILCDASMKAVLPW